MACGHFTDMDTADLYNIRGQGKYRGKYYCETCGRYQRRMPRKPPTPIPDEPMF